MFIFDNRNETSNYDMDITNEVIAFDTLQKARQDLIGEIQAVIGYDLHIRSTKDKLAKETWTNIKNEELVHVGELLGLLNYLDSSQKQYIQKGIAEFMERQER